MKAKSSQKKSSNDYGAKKDTKVKLMMNPKTNNQCKKAGMNDARDTQHS